MARIKLDPQAPPGERVKVVSTELQTPKEIEKIQQEALNVNVKDTLSRA